MPDRKNPFEDLDDLFDRLTRGLEDAGMAGGATDVAVDVSETAEDVVVAADLPGYDREDVNVTVANRRLTVEAERERSSESGDERYHRRERSHRRVRRTVTLPTDVEEESASATYENGVLTVTLPKEVPDDEDASGHRIDIS
ncbi:Hsp20/alpha crystallin family protein [Halobium salinum]|uniref:Hsp20/alpha crystallin family protein n=1 Tax=Halobium salinum TaxID=1364940 RepID=A0ABD5PCA7_9EURY|nr:Hsp20/alpha crystallin family protein [Halobium salinum]